MENINRIVSLFIGLVVVLVIFGVVSGRINLGGRLPSFLSGRQISPTAPPKASGSPTPKKEAAQTAGVSNQYNNKTTPAEEQSKDLTEIPATGAETLFIPLAISSFWLGVYLKKIKN